MTTTRQCNLCKEIFVLRYNMAAAFENPKKVEREHRLFYLEVMVHVADCKNYFIEKHLNDYLDFRTYFRNIMILPKSLKQVNKGQFLSFVNYLKKKETL